MSKRSTLVCPSEYDGRGQKIRYTKEYDSDQCNIHAFDWQQDHSRKQNQVTTGV